MDEKLKFLVSLVHYASWGTFRGFSAAGKSVELDLKPLIEAAVKSGDVAVLRALGIKSDEVREWKFPSGFIFALNSAIKDIVSVSWSDALKLGKYNTSFYFLICLFLNIIFLFFCSEFWFKFL